MKTEEGRMPWFYLPLFFMIITACFYGVMYLITSHIPTVDKLTYVYYSSPTPNTETSELIEYLLPISISKLWDVLFISILILLFTKTLRWIKKIDFFPIVLLVMMYFEIAFFLFSISSGRDAFSIYLMGLLLLGPWLIFFISLFQGIDNDLRENIAENALIALISALFLGFKVGFLLGFVLGIAIFGACVVLSILGKVIIVAYLLISVLVKKATALFSIIKKALTKKSIKPII